MLTLILAMSIGQVPVPSVPTRPVIIPKSVSGSWLTSYSDAMSRPGPYLIVVHTDNCPPCRRLESELPRDGFAGWVCLKLHSSDPIVKQLGVKAFPTIILAAKDGTIIRHDTGTVDRKELERRMRVPPMRRVEAASPVWCVGGS